MDRDPWSWTVQEVAEFFRKEAASFVKDMPNSRLPDMDHFLPVLADNDVSGSVLLTAVDASFLKDECGLRSLGIRSALMHCVSKLKACSSVYGRAAPTQHMRVATPETPLSLMALPLPSNSVASQLPEQRSPVPAAQAESNGQTIRPGEVEIEDGRGRKRRKIALSSAPVTELRPPKPLPSPGFLSDAGLPVDELFYSSTSMGHEITIDYPNDIFVEAQDLGEDLGEDNYQFYNLARPPGDTIYVERQIRHFLQNDSVRHVERRGRDAQAVVPYREHVLVGAKSQSATVFQFPAPTGQDKSSSADEEDAIAVRESIAYLDADVDFSKQQLQSSGEWDFMVQAYPVSKGPDDVLPTYASDGDDVSITSTLAAQISADEKEEREALQHEHLNAEEIKEIVASYIEVYIDSWKEKKLPGLEQDKAWSTWKKTKRSKTRRDQLIYNAEQLVDRLTKRLAKLEAELLLNEYEAEEEVEEVCKCMDITIQQRELARWEISVWQRRQEPHHVFRHGQGQSSSKSKSFTAPSQPFAVHPDDRLSFSPAPAQDTEQFRTPTGSPSPAENEDANDADHEDADVDVEMSTTAPIADFIENDSPVNTGTPSKSWSVRGEMAPAAVVTPDSDYPDTSDDLPHVSTLMPPLPTQEPVFKTPTKPASSQRAEVIVISSSDSSAPSKLGVKKMKKKMMKKDQVEFGADPMSATAAEVKSWELEELLQREDRQRLLIKMLFRAGPELREQIIRLLTSLRRNSFAERLLDTLRELRYNYNKEASSQADEAMNFCTKLFLAYCYLRPDLLASRSTPDLPWKSVVHDKQQAGLFTSVLDNVLRKNDSKLFMTPQSTPSRTQSSPQAISSDSNDSEELENNVGASGKKRKRKKKPRLSASAVESQVQALERRKRFVQAKEAHSQELAAIKQSDPSRSTVPLNLLRHQDQEPIFVPKSIADKMKDHQQSGVQFMWNELTAEGSLYGQGCILAHTMGLGKTMQAITVLVALNEAAQSENPRVYEQLPANLRPPAVQQRKRQLRAVVLCPAPLIQNWAREIRQWAPERLANVFRIEAGERGANQVHDTRKWKKIGGVLLIGYENFRTTAKRAGESKDTAPEADTSHMLLTGAEIVIADEAHRLKDESSQISKVAKQFKTESRLALTGTPMSNDVQEIYALVSWVHPGFLGDAKWFNNKFANPIKQGNGIDSSPEQVRRGRRQLATLHKKIEPKVDRAAIEVLRGSLRSKTEFVITLPLTEIQLSVYEKYVKVLVGDSNNDKASSVTIFGWLAVLTLLTNHPVAFKRKMLSPAALLRKGRRHSEELTPATDGSGTPQPVGLDADDEDATDEGLRTLGFSEHVINDLIADITDDIDANLSSKMRVLLDIVKLSRGCGDKLLVFSQSIPSLNYLSELLGSCGVSFGRIDGSVPVSKRDQIIKDFHNGATDVMLISTKAGGVGLNIQGANRVVLLDFGFNPTYEVQAIGRAYRLGQEKAVFVYRFVVGGTFEKNIYDKQMFKTALVGRVVDKKHTKRTAAWNTREYLYPPRDVPQQDLSEYLGKDEAVMDEILNRQSNSASDGTLIRKIELMETLQEEDHEEPLTEEEQKEVEAEFEQLGYVWGGAPDPLVTNAALPWARPRGRPPRSTQTGPGPSGLSNVVKLPMSPASFASTAPVPNGLPSSMPNGLPNVPSAHRLQGSTPQQGQGPDAAFFREANGRMGHAAHPHLPLQ